LAFFWKLTWQSGRKKGNLEDYWTYTLNSTNELLRIETTKTHWTMPSCMFFITKRGLAVMSNYMSFWCSDKMTANALQWVA